MTRDERANLLATMSAILMTCEPFILSGQAALGSTPKAAVRMAVVLLDEVEEHLSLSEASP